MTDRLPDPAIQKLSEIVSRLSPDLAAEAMREIDGRHNPDVVRRDCAFCGRERSRADDNHAPECPYWDFSPPRLEASP